MPMGGSFVPSAAVRGGSAAASAAASALGSPTFGSTPDQPPNYGLQMRFKVIVNAVKSLGDWSGCTGLAVNFKHESYNEGGVYDYPRLMPGTMEYSDVSLERPIDATSFTTMQAWLTEVRDKWVYGDATKYQGDSVTITLFGTVANGDGLAQVAQWTLLNALPVSWTGPTLSADANKVATEKLVLKHQGFLPPGPTS
jgi:phage tail-like protein